MLQLVSTVGVMVGVDVSVGSFDVGLIVKVEGNGVMEGSGVKVFVGVRTGV